MTSAVPFYMDHKPTINADISTQGKNLSPAHCAGALFTAELPRTHEEQDHLTEFICDRGPAYC